MVPIEDTEGALAQGFRGPTEARKGRETDSLLEPAASLTP